MKHLKKKLVAAIAMLVVSAVALTGASFAWYTLSTNPEVTNIKANLAANENLEIALDNNYASETAVDTASEFATGVQGSKTGNPYTWGNLVDLDVAMTSLNGNAATTPKLVLAPVKYNTTTLQYPEYGLDGRMSGTKDMGLTTKVSDHGSVTTANGGVEVYQKTSDSKVADALSVTYWLRSNEACNVSLCDVKARAHSTNDQSADDTDVNGVDGLGSYITIPISGENTTTVIEKYVKNLVVRFDVTVDATTTSYYAKLTKNSDSSKTTATQIWYDLSLVDSTADSATDATISLTANTAQKIKMWVYVDGEKVKNSDALLDDVTGMKLNIQFSSSNIDITGGATPGAMDGATVTTD